MLIALALALLGRCRRDNGIGRGGRPPRPLPLPVTSALFAPLLLPLRCCAITPRRLPTAPAPARFLTGLAAIALERMGRLEGLLASLQQAEARIATGRLTRRVG
jgi:hypothetical protein